MVILNIGVSFSIKLSEIFDLLRSGFGLLLSPVSRRFAEQYYRAQVRKIYAKELRKIRGQPEVAQWDEELYWNLLVDVSTDSGVPKKQRLLDLIDQCRQKEPDAPLKLLILGRPRSGKTLALLSLLKRFADEKWDSKASTRGVPRIRRQHRTPLLCNMLDFTLQEVTSLRAEGELFSPLQRFLRRRLSGQMARHFADDLRDGRYSLLFDFDKGFSSPDHFRMVESFISRFDQDEYVVTCQLQAYESAATEIKKEVLKKVGARYKLFEKLDQVVIVYINPDEMEIEVRKDLSSRGISPDKIDQVWDTLKVYRLVHTLCIFPEHIPDAIDAVLSTRVSFTDLLGKIFKEDEYREFLGELGYHKINTGNFPTHDQADAIFQSRPRQGTLKEALSLPYVGERKEGTQVKVLFTHPHAEDYFTALTIRNEWQENRDASKYVRELKWWQTLIVLGGMLPPAERNDYVRNISSVGTNSSALLAAWCVAQGESAMPDTLKSRLDEVLRKNSNGGDPECAKAIEKLGNIWVNQTISDLFCTYLLRSDDSERRGAINLMQYLPPTFLYSLLANDEQPRPVRAGVAKALGSQPIDRVVTHLKAMKTRNGSRKTQIWTVLAVYWSCRGYIKLVSEQPAGKGTPLKLVQRDVQQLLQDVSQTAAADFLAESNIRQCLPFVQLCAHRDTSIRDDAVYILKNELGTEAIRSIEEFIASLQPQDDEVRKRLKEILDEIRNQVRR